MKCKYSYRGECNFGMTCPIPQEICTEFEEDNFRDNPDKERDINADKD